MDQRSDKSNDDDEKRAQIHKIFYAELIKLFVIESDGIKKSKLSEVELDQNIILTSEEYYNRNNDIYDVSKKLFMTLFTIDISQIKYMYVYIQCCGDFKNIHKEQPGSEPQFEEQFVLCGI